MLAALSTAASCQTVDSPAAPSGVPDAVVLSAGKFYWSGNFNYGGCVEKDRVTFAGKVASQFTATALPSGGGGWLPYKSAPSHFDTKGYNYYVVTLAPTRAGQTWQLVTPENAGDQPVPGATSVTIEKYGPAPVPGVWATYKVPLHEGGLNLPVGVVFWKVGIQDQMPYGSQPANAKDNVWYIADARFTAN